MHSLHSHFAFVCRGLLDLVPVICYMMLATMEYLQMHLCLYYILYIDMFRFNICYLIFTFILVQFDFTKPGNSIMSCPLLHIHRKCSWITHGAECMLQFLLLPLQYVQ